MESKSIPGGRVEFVSNFSYTERKLKCLRSPIPKTINSKTMRNHVFAEKTFTFLYKPEASNFWAIYPVDELPGNLLGLDDLLLVTKGDYPAGA